MPSLHTRSFLRMIKRDWEIYTLQFITLSIAFATSIVIAAFAVQEFSVNSNFDDDVVRVLRRNETTEYEERNRLTDRIPVDVYLKLKSDKNFTSVGRVKSINGTYAVDEEFKKYFDGSIDYNEDTLRSLSYDPSDFGVYAKTSNVDFSISDSTSTYFLQPVKDIYFGPRVIGESVRHGDIYCVIILGCISLLIIVLATTNFVNLVSLTLPARAKELAMRKVAGAHRSPLLGLMAKESFAVVLISLSIGIILFIVFPLPITVELSIAALLVLVLLVATITAAPLFPAWAFIKASPGRLLGTDAITFPRMKMVITVVQLGVSLSLIIASLVIDRQISRSLIKEPGKNHEQVIYLPYPSNLTLENLNRLKREWPQNNPHIVELTAVSHTPDKLTSKNVGDDHYRLNVDYDFKDFFRLEMASGRWFGPNDQDSTVVNEIMSDDNATTMGVIKNFAGKYNLPDKPVRITIGKDDYNFLMIRILEVDIRNTLDVVSRFFEEVSGRPVTLSFFDKNYAEIIAYEDRLNRLSSLLAMVAGIMACCSIYALSLSRMNDNIKQIAIRKTFGASDIQIVRGLSWQFVELMLGSLFFFGPVTYLLLREWLRNFAYSAKFMWADPLISIGVCLVIVLITNLFMLARINSNTLKDLLRR